MDILHLMWAKGKLATAIAALGAAMLFLGVASNSAYDFFIDGQPVNSATYNNLCHSTGILYGQVGSCAQASVNVQATDHLLVLGTLALISGLTMLWYCLRRPATRMHAWFGEGLFWSAFWLFSIFAKPQLDRFTFFIASAIITAFLWRVAFWSRGYGRPEKEKVDANG